MVAAVASHLVKVDPETAGWWISLAYALRRTEGIEKAEAILLRAQAIHPEVAMIAFTLACYASVASRMEEAKERTARISYETFRTWCTSDPQLVERFYQARERGGSTH
jgi:hypothetical protein